MKHTIKLLTLAFMLSTILTLTGCPGPVNTVDVWDNGVVTTAPTCTTEGVKTLSEKNREKQFRKKTGKLCPTVPAGRYGGHFRAVQGFKYIGGTA